MRQKSAETYENLVRFYNRNVPVFETCECGKIMPQHKMEDHRKTGIHKLLMSYKAQCRKLMEEPAAPDPEKKKKKHRNGTSSSATP